MENIVFASIPPQGKVMVIPPAFSEPKPWLIVSILKWIASQIGLFLHALISKITWEKSAPREETVFELILSQLRPNTLKPQQIPKEALPQLSKAWGVDRIERLFNEDYKRSVEKTPNLSTNFKYRDNSNPYEDIKAALLEKGCNKPQADLALVAAHQGGAAYMYGSLNNTVNRISDNYFIVEDSRPKTSNALDRKIRIVGEDIEVLFTSRFVLKNLSENRIDELLTATSSYTIHKTGDVEGAWWYNMGPAKTPLQKKIVSVLGAPMIKHPQDTAWEGESENDTMSLWESDYSRLAKQNNDAIKTRGFALEDIKNGLPKYLKEILKLPDEIAHPILESLVIGNINSISDIPVKKMNPDSGMHAEEIENLRSASITVQEDCITTTKTSHFNIFELNHKKMPLKEGVKETIVATQTCVFQKTSPLNFTHTLEYRFH